MKQLAGGWKQVPPGPYYYVPSNVTGALRKASREHINVTFTPLLYIGDRVRAGGREYAILCRMNDRYKGEYCVILFLFCDAYRESTIINIRDALSASNSNLKSSDLYLELKVRYKDPSFPETEGIHVLNRCNKSTADWYEPMLYVGKERTAASTHWIVCRMRHKDCYVIVSYEGPGTVLKIYDLIQEGDDNI